MKYQNFGVRRHSRYSFCEGKWWQCQTASFTGVRETMPGEIPCTEDDVGLGRNIQFKSPVLILTYLPFLACIYILHVLKLNTYFHVFGKEKEFLYMSVIVVYFDG